MFNFEDLKVAKKNITEKRSGSSEVAYNEGLKILELFNANPSITRLESASEKFVEALEYNNEHVPSIIYISYILYMLGNNEMALKYIKNAERLMTFVPPDILKYKESIEESLVS